MLKVKKKSLTKGVKFNKKKGYVKQNKKFLKFLVEWKIYKKGKKKF